VQAIFKLYEGLKRQGPGSKSTTVRALNAVRKKLPQSSKILDIGCGCGAQTLDIAESISGDITAVDVYQPYLDNLLERGEMRKLKASLKVLNSDMRQLSFPEETFDLIWSEGAIYLMGMENGLKLWKNFLKHTGFIVFSEISWFLENPPHEIFKFWRANYPAIKSISQNLDTIKTLGFTIVDHFSLPDDTWMENYYAPLLNRITDIQQSANISTSMQEVIDETLLEVELYRKYSTWYGYEFYIIQPLR
jgi:ubiquinone/menaquinone biosynthesis C-methylase UbiE